MQGEGKALGARWLPLRSECSGPSLAPWRLSCCWWVDPPFLREQRCQGDKDTYLPWNQNIHSIRLLHDSADSQLPPHRWITDHHSLKSYSLWSQKLLLKYFLKFMMAFIISTIRYLLIGEIWYFVFPPCPHDIILPIPSLLRFVLIHILCATSLVPFDPSVNEKQCYVIRNGKYKNFLRLIMLINQFWVLNSAVEQNKRQKTSGTLLQSATY